MLVLSRRIGERLVIDEKITVIEAKGGQIRLGTDAPKEVPVRREVVVVRETVAA